MCLHAVQKRFLAFEFIGSTGTAKKIVKQTATFGGLHPERIPFITCVVLVEESDEMVYLVKNLHTTVHYGLFGCDVEDFRTDVAKFNIPLLDIDPTMEDTSTTHTDIAVWYGGQQGFGQLRSVFDGLGLRERLKYLHGTEGADHISDRGNVHKSFGYSGMNQQRDIANGVYEAKPMLNKGTMSKTVVFRLMTKLAKVIQHTVCHGMRTDPMTRDERQETFATRIHPNNIWEALTEGAYLIDEDNRHILKSHIDIGNAQQDGLNWQLVARCSVLQRDGISRRTYFVGAYNRQCCYDYMERNKRSSCVHQELEKTVKDLTLSRVSIDTSTRSFEVKKTRGHVNYVVGSIEKATLYSYLREISNTVYLSLTDNWYDQIQVCYMSVCVSSFDVVWNIIQDWTASPEKLSGDDLIFQFLKEMAAQGGCTGGDGAINRFQPHYNKPTTRAKIYESLIVIMNTVDEINMEDKSSQKKGRMYTEKDATLSKTKCSDVVR